MKTYIIVDSTNIKDSIAEVEYMGITSNDFHIADFYHVKFEPTNKIKNGQQIVRITGDKNDILKFLKESWDMDATMEDVEERLVRK